MQLRLVFSIILLLQFLHSYCQDSLCILIAKNVCICLNSKEIINYKIAVDCVNSEMENQSELFEKEGVAKYGISISEKESSEFAKEIGLKSSLNLIENCSTYTKLMDTARYSLYSYLNRDSLLTEITKLNLMDSSIRNLNFYIKRCRMLFWIVNFEGAFKDAQQILILDNTNQLGLHVTAMHMELNKDYPGALEIYKNLYNISSNPRYAIDEAIVQWKFKKEHFNKTK